LTGIYYDPYDYEIDADPYPVWKRMRDDAPVYWNEQYQFWALSALPNVRDVTTIKIRPRLDDNPIILITCMMDGANPLPSRVFRNSYTGNPLGCGRCQEIQSPIQVSVATLAFRCQ
jgi:hypothetical protein